MEFKKYPSITNSYNQKFLDKIQKYSFDKEIYCVTEKVHGANFAIYWENGEFRIASRQRFLADNDNFYGCQRFLPQLKKSIDLYCKIREKNGNNITQFVLYGEICGGRYPHTDVKFNQNAKKVQSCVWYHPDNIFYAFDIKINNKFLSQGNFVFTCISLGDVLFAKSLCHGTLQECLEFNNKYQTKIPLYFRLPEIKDNFCEGNIIKPIKPLFFPSGKRIILKNKNERFSEISRKKETINKDICDILSLDALKLSQVLSNYCTENRLNNTLSKLGNVTIENFGEIIKNLNEDVINDFLSLGDKNANLFHLLKKSEQKYLRKFINSKNAQLIKNWWKLHK